MDIINKYYLKKGPTILMLSSVHKVLHCGNCPETNKPTLWVTEDIEQVKKEVTFSIVNEYEAYFYRSKLNYIGCCLVEIGYGFVFQEFDKQLSSNI